MSHDVFVQSMHHPKADRLPSRAGAELDAPGLESSQEVIAVTNRRHEWASEWPFCR